MVFFLLLKFELRNLGESNAVPVEQKSHACLLNPPSNLLISLKKRKVGQVLDFDKELKNVAKKIKRTKSLIKTLKGKTDSTSNSKRKRLKKAQSNLKLLSKGIIACREGVTSLTLPVDCTSSSNPEGSTCEDFNPCTRNDKCVNLKCTGTAASDSTILKCGFDKCSIEIQQCLNSRFVVCMVGAAGSEICNAVDDDCNGQTDESNVCVSVNASPTATVVASPTGSVVTPNATTTPPISPTNNPVNTLTPTSTATRTLTPTHTATRTPTRTSTPTRTPTRTSTPTPVPCGAANNNTSSNPTNCGCVSNNDCCSGICRGSDDTCGPPTSIYNTQAAVTCPNFICDANARAGASARPLDAPCNSNLDCCSGICRGATGTCGPKTSIPNVIAAPCCL